MRVLGSLAAGLVMRPIMQRGTDRHESEHKHHQRRCGRTEAMQGIRRRLVWPGSHAKVYSLVLWQSRQGVSFWGETNSLTLNTCHWRPAILAVGAEGFYLSDDR